MLTYPHHLGRMADILVGELAYVYESVLVDADINKGAEVGDIGYDARQHHAGLEIVNALNPLIVAEPGSSQFCCGSLALVFVLLGRVARSSAPNV